MALLIGRMHSLPGKFSRGDAVSRCLDLLEGFIAALLDFESRKQGGEPITYQRVRLGVSDGRSPGSAFWMSVSSLAGLEHGARVELNDQQGLRGLVAAVRGNDVCVRLDVPVARDSMPAAGSLRRVHEERLYQMQREAVSRVREGNAVNPQLIRALADRTFLPLSSRAPTAVIDSSLNSDQREAAVKACQVQDFLLVTSPPGTGRMHTASEIISQCVRRGERVLAVGPTNIGVDSLLSALPQDIAKVRVARRNSLSALLGDPGPLNIDVVELDSATGVTPSIAVGEAMVVAGTTAGIALSGITVGRAFDLLVIVEAERVSLPSAIVPLASARRAVLIGDPRQLPLFVDAEAHDWIRRLAGGAGDDRPGLTMEGLLTTSLFELLLAETPSSNKVVLTTQYRMPSAVADFISHNFYEGKLSPGLMSHRGSESVSHSPLPHSFTIVDTSCLPRRQREERIQGQPLHVRSYANEAEADIIAAIVAAEDRLGRDWAVAVPYAAQAHLIRERLRRALGPGRAAGDLEALVGTIDAFQGSEHDLVIVGCTRSNRSGSVGFLQDVRRFNVAMTRARGQLVVVGDMQTLTSARDLPVRALMSAMVSHVQRRGEVISADEVIRRLR